jgi:hypothetical protein
MEEVVAFHNRFRMNSRNSILRSFKNLDFVIYNREKIISCYKKGDKSKFEKIIKTIAHSLDYVTEITNLTNALEIYNKIPIPFLSLRIRNYVFYAMESLFDSHVARIVGRKSIIENIYCTDKSFENLIEFAGKWFPETDKFANHINQYLLNEIRNIVLIKRYLEIIDTKFNTRHSWASIITYITNK